MDVVNHHTVEELAARTKAETDARVVRRLFAVIAAVKGAEAKQIAADCAASLRTVQYWIERYNHSGIDGLRDAPGRGRRPALPKERLAEFKSRIEAGPTDADGGVSALRGKDAQRILEEQFGVMQSLSATYETLKRAGLTVLRPRPKHTKSDPGAMRAWLDKAPLFSKKSASPPRSKPSRSGSKTKRGSGNKAR